MSTASHLRRVLDKAPDGHDMDAITFTRAMVRSVLAELTDLDELLDAARRDHDRARAAYERQTAKLVRIAARHKDDGTGDCAWCSARALGRIVNWPCPDYRDAAGVES